MEQRPRREGRGGYAGHRVRGRARTEGGREPEFELESEPEPKAAGRKPSERGRDMDEDWQQLPCDRQGWGYSTGRASRVKVERTFV